MKRELTCIICPRGCALTVNETPDGLSVSGNACPRGERYALDECTHPMRTVTATVRVSNRPDTMVSVKTETPVPKEHMMDVMAQLRRVSVPAPITAGTVILPDLFGSAVIATQTVQ